MTYKKLMGAQRTERLGKTMAGAITGVGLAGLTLASAPAAAGETLTGIYDLVIVSSEHATMANGDVVMLNRAKGSATHGSPDSPAIMVGECLVLVRTQSDGTYGDQGYCTWSASAEDRYTIRFATGPEGDGTFEIVGGSGRWAGASGSGSYTTTWQMGDASGGTYETNFD